MHDGFDVLPGFFVGALEEELAGHTDTRRFHGLQGLKIVGHGLRGTHRVVLVLAGQDVEQQGDVRHRAGEDADVVQAAGQRIHAVDADAPERRLEADAAAVGRGPHGRAVRLRAERAET